MFVGAFFFFDKLLFNCLDFSNDDSYFEVEFIMEIREADPTIPTYYIDYGKAQDLDD